MLYVAPPESICYCVRAIGSSCAEKSRTLPPALIPVASPECFHRWDIPAITLIGTAFLSQSKCKYSSPLPQPCLATLVLSEIQEVIACPACTAMNHLFCCFSFVLLALMTCGQWDKYNKCIPWHILCWALSFLAFAVVLSRILWG